jgi:hypothetical protein
MSTESSKARVAATAAGGGLVINPGTGATGGAAGARGGDRTTRLATAEAAATVAVATA